MKIYFITIGSKDKKSVRKFIKLLTEHLELEKLNLIGKTTFKKSRTRRISILKSPHVNKKAQEQFEFRVFLTTLIIETTQNFKILTLIKKTKNITFADIKVKVNVTIKKKSKSHLRDSIFRLRFYQRTKVRRFLTFLDSYGEISLMQQSYVRIV